MNKLDKTYTDLLQDILDNGVTKSDRTGTGTISIFGRQIRHKMSDGFPLLTTKKIPFRLIVTELLWFLNGDTNIKYLVDNNCHIWDGDAYKNYEKITNDFQLENPIDDFIIKTIRGEMIKIETEDGDDYRILTKEEFINKIKTNDEFAKKWGDLGPVYGKQWRNWCGYEKVPSGWNHGAITHYKEVPKCDQLTDSINLLKTDPDSRRNRVSSWNVGELDQMTLPPCHTDFQFYTRELSIVDRIDLASKKYDNFDIMDFGIPFKCTHEDIDKYYPVPRRAISLMWNQRSVDTFLGLPFNIASYGLLLEIIAKSVNMVPDELVGNLGDTHLYLNHVEQAKEQIGRELTIEERGSLYRKQQNLSDDVGLIGTDRDAHRVFDDYGITKRTREPFPLPKLKHLRSDDKYTLLNEFPSLWDEFKISDFEMENYQSHPTIKAPLSN